MQAFAAGQAILDPGDRNIPVDQLQPETKRLCHKFLNQAFHHGMPPPSKEEWFRFGFPVCKHEGERGRLSGLYTALLFGRKLENSNLENSLIETPLSAYKRSPTFNFTEFWKAYESSTLFDCAIMNVSSIMACLFQSCF